MYRPVQKYNPRASSRRSRAEIARIANRTSPLWIRWSCFALFLVSIAILFVTVFRPWRVRHTQWQTYRHAETESWAATEKYAEGALFWKPGDPSLRWIRTRARIGNDFSRLDPDDLPDLSDQLHPQAILAAAELHQAAGDWDATATLLPQLALTLPRDPRVLLLFARQALHEGDVNAALDWSLALVDSVPDDASTRLLVARLKLMEDDLFSKLDATRQLFDAAGDPGSVGAEAIDFLVDLSNQIVLSAQERDQLAERITRHPLASTKSRLFAAAVEISRMPDERNTIIRETVAAHKSSHPLLLAQWLQSIDEAEQSLAILETLPEISEDEKTEVAQLQLGAYLLLGRENEALDFIARFEDTIGSSDSELIRFLLLLRDPATPPDQLRNQAEKALNGALSVGSDRTLLLIARLAASAQMIDLAIQAIDGVDFESAPLPLKEEAVTLKFNYLGMSRRARDAFNHAAQFPEIIRSNATRLNNYVYLGLLLGENVAPDLEQLTRLVGGDPRFHSHADTIAYAKFRQGDLDQAAQWFRKVPDASVAANPATALLGAILEHHAGNRAAAQRKLDSINPANLFPEERIDYHRLQDALAASSSPTL